jgi:PTH1 family peptidyl-tRNA hydrolase
MPKGIDVTSWVLSKAIADDQRQEERIFTALMEELPTVLGGDLALASNHMHLYLQES